MAAKVVEFWRSGGPASLNPTDAARQAEADGWDGQMFMDSQSLGADPYVIMGPWSAVTTRLRLATGVTNPLTRHSAVTACAAATLQAISGGRTVLGIGRGDSALAYLGYAPTALARFEQILEDLQTLLSGGDVSFGWNPLEGEAAFLEKLSLGDRPDAARLAWLPPDLPKVPLDVAATGPKVIAMATRLGERVTFSVGAEARRLRWAIGLAEAARLESGITQRPSYGAQVVVVCHRDPCTMRDAATRLVAPLARFQVIQGTVAGPIEPEDAASYDAIARGYAMSKHSDFKSDKLVGDRFDFDFVRRFAIVGDADHCIERLVELAQAGVSRFVIFGPGFHEDGTPDGDRLFARTVMPAVRAALRYTNAH